MLKQEFVTMYMTDMQSLGETIRQMRRQRSMTQTELGGEHFSKSYVSAVERDKITPSYEAMRFFAAQLEQSSDYFENMYLENERAKRAAMSNNTIQPSSNTQMTHVYADGDGNAGNGNSDGNLSVQMNFLPLLDTVLEQIELSPSFSQQTPFTEDATQFITVLPSPFQGRFAYLLGLQEMQQGNLTLSMQMLEQALTLAPIRYQPAILDALGMNLFIQKDYHTALHYHLRALRLLEKDEEALSSPLGLKVYFHSGNAARLLGAYEQARDYYEKARALLSHSTDMHTTGQLLQFLGYSLYAYAYQLLDISINATELEQTFQRAIGMLVQSRTLYQIMEDRAHETQARLTHSMVLLDMSTWRRLLAQEKARQTGTVLTTTNITLLNEAEEQNRQVLLTWLQKSEEDHTAILSAEVEIYLYSAMTNLVHVYAQRAILANFNGYANTTQRESALAIHYCQQLLNSLNAQEFPWSLVYNMASLQHSDVQYQFQQLPHLPSGSSSRQILSQSATYLAAAMVAELQGRTTTTPDYAYDAYAMSDECIHFTLDTLQAAYTQNLVDMDVSYLLRTYQRCSKLLEEREQVANTQGVEINGTLRKILKEGLQRLTKPRL